MAGVLLIFAFSMSLVINVVEKRIASKDEPGITDMNEQPVMNEQ